MKFFPYIIAFFFLAGILACEQQPAPPAQETPASEPVMAVASRYWSQPTAFTTDTLTDADTATYTVGNFFRPVALEVIIAADSLSGATAATATLEQSIDGSEWFVVDTETINGVTSRLKATGDILGGQVRLRVISTGTQSTALRMDALVAESTPQQ